MNYEHEDLIDLGAVSVETQGGPSGVPDIEGTLQRLAGLSDE